MVLTKKFTPITFTLVYFLLLVVVAATTPITPSEAQQFYSNHSTIGTILMHWGQNLLSGEIGFRFPFLLLGILNSFLFYSISQSMLKTERDSFLALILYLLLPGVVASAVLSSNAVIMSSMLLLFLFLYLRQSTKLAILPLFFLMFVHWSASFLYLILIVYLIIKKDKYMLVYSLVLLLVYMFVGTSIPKQSTGSYFFELLGLYATVLSPFLFIYIFYALYRTLFRGGRDIIWYISFLAFIMSLLFSLDEKVRIVDFSPYIMIGIIVAVRTYNHSLRVRLKQFRKGYRVAFVFICFSLVISTLSLLLHQPLYRLLGKENYTIVKAVYEPYDLSQKLHSQGVECIENMKEKAYDQMRYYGIKKCY